MKVLVVGCGYLGTHLGTQLAREGHAVWGLKRRPETLKGVPIAPVKADLAVPESLTNLPPAEYVVLCQAPGRGETYLSAYSEGTRNFLRAARGMPVKKLVFVSSTGVYGIRDGSEVTETTPTGTSFENREAAGNAGDLLDAEKFALTGPFPSVVLRLGGLYGPGRNRLAMLREGRLVPSGSAAYMNRIRVEDAALAVRTLWEKGKEANVYLGVDDLPSTQMEFYAWLCPRLDLAVPPPSLGEDFGKRCSNAKLKELGWAPRYRDYREGYEDLLHEGVKK